MSGHHVVTCSCSLRLQGIFVCLVAIVTITVFGTYFVYPVDRTSVNVRLMKPYFVNTSSTPFMERKLTKAPVTASRNECHIVHEKLNSCNGLPNFFLYEKQRHHFQNAIINFWHLAKASGSTVGHCLVDIYKKFELPMAPRGGTPCSIKQDLLEYKNYLNSSKERPIIRSHHSVGLCDFIKEKITDRKCSVFTIFRDPHDRLVSFYFFKRQVARKKAPGDKILNQTIKEWISRSRSSVWEAFSNEWTFERKHNGKEQCKDLHHLDTQEKRWPPIDEHLTDIANNLDKHLSFIGLTEDLPTTFRMLEEVYGLPFVEVCSDMHVLPGTYDNTNATEQRALKLAAKREITEDPEIQRLIQFEVLMYEKAKKIFEAQKEMFLKMKRSKRSTQNLS